MSVLIFLIFIILFKYLYAYPAAFYIFNKLTFFFHLYIIKKKELSYILFVY